MTKRRTTSKNRNFHKPIKSAFPPGQEIVWEKGEETKYKRPMVGQNIVDRRLPPLKEPPPGWRMPSKTRIEEDLRQAMFTESVETHPSGAIRSNQAGKIDPEAALCPHVLETFARYMAFQRVMPDGRIRSDGDWKRGMPDERYLKALIRHTLTLWRDMHDESPCSENTLTFSLCAIMFNTMGLLSNRIKSGSIEADFRAQVLDRTQLPKRSP